MDGWVKVFTSGDRFSVELVKGMLSENNIEAIIMDKCDSAYGIFGDVELYVSTENAVRALHLINK